jgi:L-threonylcarbamoyladenylate synthase
VAVENLVNVRGREPQKPLIVLVADATMAEMVAAEFPEPARRLAARFWPGPLTLVLPARAGLPPAVTAGSGTVGVRVPGHPVARALVAGFGAPVTAPSANPPGAEPPRMLGAARAYFGARVAVYVDGGALPGGATTVAAVDAGGVRVFRAGSISVSALDAALAED